MHELGCTTLGKIDIQLKEGSNSVETQPHHVSRDDRTVIKWNIKTWCVYKIVADTTSPSPPMILVKKRNGNSRIVIDYVRISVKTVK